MVYVIGEALIDLVLAPAAEVRPGDRPTGSAGCLAHPGGSPYNVAIGLARLGQPARLLARLSADAFGSLLRAHAAGNGVDLSLAVPASEPATLAVVSLDAEQNARYDFYRTGTADWQWTAAELDRLPAAAGWVHTGSLASWTAPGADLIEARLNDLAPGTVLSYDPNIRPALLAEHRPAVARIERLVALATVLKASAEDLAWLYPDVPIGDVLRRWRELGPELVVVTDGSRGAHAIAATGASWTVPGRPVRLVDTVGAGDSFMAGLINALARDGGLAPAGGWAMPGPDRVRAAIEEASLVASLTCGRAGADPPTAAELATAQLAGG